MASTNTIRPKPRSVSEIRSNLLKPATTSHFDVFIREPTGNEDYTWNNFKDDNQLQGYNKDFLHLACSEASLPGSSLLTHEITGDRHGVTERHAYRRNFDGRIELSFYVMISPSNVESEQSIPNRYLPIRFFEGWMKYISAEEKDKIGQSNYSYRMRYPEEYYGGLSIVKYEKDYNAFLSYQFINAYPLQMASIPVSYDSSNLLKCTVTFSYVRYYIEDVSGSSSRDTTKLDLSNPFSESATPLEQASFNSAPGYFSNPEFGVSSTTGGVNSSTAKSSGNTIDRKVEAGLPYVGRNVGPIAPFSGL